MTFDDYGQFTVDLWVSGPDQTIEDIDTDSYAPEAVDAERSFNIMCHGLAGETGEVIENIKKYLRDGTYDKDKVRKELGDVIYYWARITRFLGMQPSEVIAANIEKLTSRKERGVLRGSGDNR